MSHYIDRFENIRGILESDEFSYALDRFNDIWRCVEEYKVYENLAVVGNEPYELSIFGPPDDYNEQWLSRAGDCALITITRNENSELKIYVDSANKIKALNFRWQSYTYFGSSIPSVDVFIGTDFVRILHIVIPKDELSEVLFQLSTVMDHKLSFIEDLL